MSQNENGWQKVRFDQIATNVNERVDKPSQSGYERWVGLKYLDVGSLTVKRWGSVEDVKSSVKVFRKKDILVGRRFTRGKDPQLEKRASVVDFDGVCSGDAYVVREKSNLISPGILKFLLNTPKFWKYAVENADGSFSIRVKWRDLKEYEFALPPIEKQKEIAELLWEVENSIENAYEKINEVTKLRFSLMNDLCSLGIGHKHFRESKIGKIPESWKLVILDEMGEFYKGKGIKKDDIKEDGIPCITYGEIYTKYEIVIDKFNSFINKETATGSKLILNGDILFAGSGETIKEIGKPVAFINNFEAYAGGDVIIFRPTNRDNINSEFLSYCLNSGKMTRSRCRLGQGSTVMHIYSKFLKTLTVPIPPLPEQKQIASILSDADAKIDALRAHREKLVALKASLIETLLDPGTANA